MQPLFLKINLNDKRKMEKNLEELKDWQDGAKRELERDLEHLMETVQQKQNFLKAMECTGELIAENSDLRDENESLRDEVESLRQQLQEEREARSELEAKLSELDEQSAGAARKSSQDDIVNALRIFLSSTEPKVINVTGNYNDIHDNSRVVGLNE